VYIWHALLLVGSSFLAGIVNAVAGGGSLFIYPLLLSLGIAPINANATTTFTVWPGALSSAYGYRKHIKNLPAKYYWLLLPSIIGGLFGAIILKRTTNHTFEFIVPWFILLAVCLLALQTNIHRWLYTKKNIQTEKKHWKILLTFIALGLFVVSIYGGYFGAGFGIIMLAFLGLTELTDIQQMNGLKNLAGVSINLVASLYFIIYRLVDWKELPLLLVGSILGGIVGSVYGIKLPGKVVRIIVIATGAVVAIVLFIKL